ncbi:MAG: hypothetical protein ACRECH_12845, partial [Nitrososphaerales archaeon]
MKAAIGLTYPGADGQVIPGDAKEVLGRFEDETIDFCMTSPPYFGLRDYSPDAITVWDGDESCEHHQFEMEYFQISSNHSKNFNERCHGRGAGQRKQETSKQINSQRGFCVRCHAFKGQL